VARVDAAGIDGLVSRNGRLFARSPQRGDEVAVTVRYLRPLTSRTEIVLLDGKGLEVVTLMTMDGLPAEQRRVLEEALKERYHLVTITRVLDVDVLFGTRYWRVETDRGSTRFALREPGKNVTWLGQRHLVLRDTAGNRYEVPDTDALDARSRRWISGSL
jgi:hypothetical protein